MSPLSPPIQAVLELFQGPLAEVRFAEVDAGVLANSSSAVEAAASAVAEQEARLTELRQTLADRQEALLVLAQRALAYARVYAEHDEALTEQLTRISLPRANKPRKASAKAGTESSASGTESSASGTESSASGTEASLEPAAADEVTAADATPAAEEVAEPNTDAPSLDAQPSRKGKRRTSVARDDAQSA